MSTRHPAFLWIFLLVLAPIAAVVVLSALLLFGVPPQLVFAPGRAIKSLLELCGFHPANRVAVAGTGLVFWAAIAAIGLAWDQRRLKS
jgi:hypothetical protein